MIVVEGGRDHINKLVRIARDQRPANQRRPDDLRPLRSPGPPRRPKTSRSPATKVRTAIKAAAQSLLFRPRAGSLWPRRLQASSHIRSTTRMPSRPSPRRIVRAVRSHSSSRLRRTASLVGPNHRALLQERRKAVGQVEQIAGQMVRPIVGQHGRKDLGELQQRQGQRPLGRLLQDQLARRVTQLLDVGTGLGHHAVRPGVGVLHVRGRVAVHGQHLVVAELVVAGAVLRQVGIFDRADADRFGHLAPLGVRQLRPIAAWRRRWR